MFKLLKVPVPLNTLEYIIERQDEYEKAKLQRANPEHQKKRYSVTKHFLTSVAIFSFKLYINFKKIWVVSP